MSRYEAQTLQRRPSCPQLASMGVVGREIGQLIRTWVDSTATYDWSKFRAQCLHLVPSTISADSPWRFNDRGSRMAPDQKIKRRKSKGYDTLPLQDICNMPVGDVAALDAHLYLWCPAALLFSHALPVLICWGFTPVLVIPWVKVQTYGTPAWHHELSLTAGGQIRHVLGGLQIGGGHYWRHATELCIFAMRGRLPVPPAKRLANVLFAPRERNAATGEKHSTKPAVMLKRIEHVSPGPYLELFARSGRPGWASFGDQL